MQYFLLVLLLSNITLSLRARILGGYEVEPKFQYPWMIAIQHEGNLICSGIAITRRSIITSAHCTNFNIEGYALYHHRHNLTLSNESEKGQRLVIDDIKRNIIYIPSTNMNDIAVIHLKHPIKGEIGKVRLDSGKLADQRGLLAKAIGWGYTSLSDIQTSDVLMEINLPIIAYYDCYVKWQPYGYPVTEYSHVCVGGDVAGKDTCKGDSGGPLFKEISPNEIILIGLTTFGYPCGHIGFPTLFTRIGSFQYFLRTNIV